jgi:EpsI family protein
VLPALSGDAGRDEVPPLTPTFKGAAAEATRTYGQGADAVGVHVAYYRQQGYGAKLVSSDNTVLRADDRHWVRTSQAQQQAPLGAGSATFDVSEVLQGGASSAASRQRLEVRQIYWIDGRWTANNQMAVLLSVLSRLQGRGDDAAAVTLVAAGDASHTRAALDTFGREHMEDIARALAAARAQR